MLNIAVYSTYLYNRGFVSSAETLPFCNQNKIHQSNFNFLAKMKGGGLQKFRDLNIHVQIIEL